MRARKRSRTPDRLCGEAVELAREVAQEAAHPRPVGEYLGPVTEGDRLVTHLFDSDDPAYRGWRWGVTVARASRARHVTVDEVTLMPGPDALVAPAWVPWSERLRPGDLGPGDLLPAESDDPRLQPGFLGDITERPPEGAVTEVPGEEADEAVGAVEPAQAAPARGSIHDVAAEVGLGRRRLLSRYGLEEAAERWEDGYGASSAMAQAAPAPCATCGFLMPLAGPLRQAFGVCANEYAPADGHVVSLSYGCGAHSEAAESPRPPRPTPPVIDHVGADPL